MEHSELYLWFDWMGLLNPEQWIGEKVGGKIGGKIGGKLRKTEALGQKQNWNPKVWPTYGRTDEWTYLHLTWVGARDACTSKNVGNCAESEFWFDAEQWKMINNTGQTCTHSKCTPANIFNSKSKYISATSRFLLEITFNTQPQESVCNHVNNQSLNDETDFFGDKDLQPQGKRLIFLVKKYFLPSVGDTLWHLAVGIC